MLWQSRWPLTLSSGSQPFRGLVFRRQLVVAVGIVFVNQRGVRLQQRLETGWSLGARKAAMAGVESSGGIPETALCAMN